MKRIIVDCLSTQIRSALVEDGQLIELVVENRNKKICLGNIYVGTIRKILPTQFAFVDIGDDKNTFLYLNDKKEEMLYTYNQNKGKSELSIKQGQEIIVQVIKEAIDQKGAVVTTQLSFTGKYVVLLANDKSIGISKKIEDDNERIRLKQIAEDCLYDDFGIIMRTNCQNADSQVIINEIKELIFKHNDIINKGQYTKAPSLIYKEANETQKIIRDFITSDVDEVIINDITEFQKFNNFQDTKSILYEASIPIFDYYFIEKQIEKALHNKIWLKSGGFIVIEQTEACNIIDVNTGKHIGKSHHNTVLKTNIEATTEIAKQIRLRNLSGMIIVDFIDMPNAIEKEQILNLLKKLVKRDRISTTVVGMTELGLMQITRKKMRLPLNKVLLCPCPFCNGVGYTSNESYICDKIRNEICSIFAQTIYNEVILSSSNKIINVFKGDNDDYKLIEKKYNAKIVLNVIQTQRLDYYSIEKRKI